MVIVTFFSKIIKPISPLSVLIADHFESVFVGNPKRNLVTFSKIIKPISPLSVLIADHFEPDFVGNPKRNFHDEANIF